MGKLNLSGMDVDDLWRLHEQVTKILSEKISAEKLELEKRLAHLADAKPFGEAGRNGHPPRRKYPKVMPKYRNPSAPAETWSGRGKQPRWLVAALQSGRLLEDMRIAEATTSRGNDAPGGP
jgi:DNA-binding protein H-NS